MPARVDASRAVAPRSTEAQLPTGTFKVSGQNVMQPYVEIRRQPDGAIRLATAAVVNGPRGLGQDPKDTSWVKVFEKPGFATRIDNGVEAEGGRFSSQASSTVRNGALVQTEEVTRKGSWLSKDVRTVSEQVLSVENGKVVYTQRNSTFEGRHGDWKLKFPVQEWQQTYEKV